MVQQLLMRTAGAASLRSALYSVWDQAEGAGLTRCLLCFAFIRRRDTVCAVRNSRCCLWLVWPRFILAVRVQVNTENAFSSLS